MTEIYIETESILSRIRAKLTGESPVRSDVVNTDIDETAKIRFWGLFPQEYAVMFYGDRIRGEKPRDPVLGYRHKSGKSFIFTLSEGEKFETENRLGRIRIQHGGKPPQWSRK